MGSRTFQHPGCGLLLGFRPAIGSTFELPISTITITIENNVHDKYACIVGRECFSNFFIPTIMSDSEVEQQRNYFRKREVNATESERYQLYAYSQAHSKATQHELSNWFSTKFKKQINQSTVSCILKRF